MSKSSDLLKIIEAGIDAVRPAVLFPKLFAQPEARLEDWQKSPSRFLLCIGKAALDSTAAVLNQTEVSDYFVIALSSSVLPPGLDQQKVHAGSHPVPDERSLNAARDLISWLRSLPESGNLLVVLSGGASALMVAPLPGISLEDKMRVNEQLLKSGASIHEMNVVRKHLSAVKGGRLAAETVRLSTLALVISDVIGDDLATIGSGPFYPDPSTFEDARVILKKYEIWEKIPAPARSLIQKGVSGEVPETPKRFDHPIPHSIIASNHVARIAAEEEARRLGYHVRASENEIQGLVEEVATQMVQQLKALPERSAFIAGGEVTVRLRGEGIGGRNQHLALLLTAPLAGSQIAFAAAGTDGVDGISIAAGAWTDGETESRALKKKLDLSKAITQFNSFPFFQSLQQSIMTGPTGTNVMDLYIGLS